MGDRRLYPGAAIEPECAAGGCAAPKDEVSWASPGSDDEPELYMTRLQNWKRCNGDVSGSG